MTIEHFDALERLQTIRQQLDELSRRFASKEALGEWVPAVDIIDEGDHFRILVDVPGVKNQDLELKEEGQTITLAGIRHPQPGGSTGRSAPPEHFAAP